MAGAEASKGLAEFELSRTEIRAPRAGRLSEVSARVGQLVSAGTQLMYIVPDDLWVVANFKETQVGLLRAGQPVKLEVDALPDFEIAGRVESISPGTGAEFSILPPENATGNFTKIVQRITVRIAIIASPKVRRLLVPGMSVVAVVDTRNAAGELKEISSTDK